MRRIPIRRSTTHTQVDPDPEAEQRILDGLNDKQREAVTTTEGPVMIIAGPGSGKTRALTHRIAYLLAAGKAQPRDILALTFTNKAANEMQERVEALVGDDARGMWVGTFHSSFARLLRMEGDKIGYSEDFSIYDTADSKRLIRQQMKGRNLDTDVVKPRSVQRMISSAKNEMIDPQEYAELARGDQQEIVAEVYPAYERALKQANALDFDDLLLKPIELFEQHEDVLEKYQRRWQYVHIDEYQDTNQAQYVLARKLSGRHKNLCVVGDDAQSIYAFRGADITNILNFDNDYPDATTIRLERNYRSTENIIRLADSIIEENDDQIEKSLWTDNAEGEYVALMEALSEKDEAQKIERRVRDLHLRDGMEYGDFAVLYRTNAQSRAIEEALRKENVPYRVIGGTSFYERKEIKDVLAYLKLLVNPNDTASLQRVINYPTRGIGDKTQARLQRYAQQHSLSLWQAVERVEEIETLGTRAERAVGKFRRLIARYASKAGTGSVPADELARDLIQDAGLLSELRKEHTRENLQRWENVQELISALAEYVESTEDATISTFLQEVALMTDQDEAEEGDDKVTLMTLHAAKGTEFPVVFVAGLEEGLFPLEQATQEKAELEEERRLFYVGVTRAEERLYLSWARSRYRYGEQTSNTRSRFLEEVDSDVVRTEAGGELEQQTDRFSAEEGPSADYDEMDPHYYRQDLSGDGGATGSSDGLRRIESTDGGGGRRVVYDEGHGEIVPGAQVEHQKFGRGKVQSLEGEGDKATAVVFFGSDVGNKKLKLKYANLRVIG
ncbi:DNA helicase-2/ATP-dependent DNA helicase PcrA [Salinibacter ruber]|uniref:ATP-dependent helicase n=1 Tax=Salinibacter ruber TaxID=146919 RepID=UPI002167A781|nr:UvrD-helicase domain-containing protein [Salinibacter ruber]MCS3671089.1 DNA helicase-2/ATP-dependent DNA helicase PcrA [Salinibacter ruber]MCS3695635.1 DNA helicase-2/ATP-dependent DNA helicase PcrA [Salinibacter ruber]MCS3935126.1 DNA helicase-2/ATP-dependent DNA helicase PcrA [Salinibacter ruber]MCS4043161.1 DNA helicase-2/ATP-dependent DNA helicase PcrA [Salinibacter ruber]MCS4174536.1 DNA helicase-2/ATP-dependent DNA helicase PcrA [Salinibacter ruber]